VNVLLSQGANPEDVELVQFMGVMRYTQSTPMLLLLLLSQVAVPRGC
jgi:hypothetical protein